MLDSEVASGVSVSLSAEGRPRSGTNELQIAFQDPASSAHVAVTNVSAEAVMPAMGSMPQMTESLAVEKSAAEGRYTARGKLPANGTWQIRVRFTGPAGPAQAVLEVNAS